MLGSVVKVEKYDNEPCKVVCLFVFFCFKEIRKRLVPDWKEGTKENPSEFKEMKPGS